MAGPIVTNRQAKFLAALLTSTTTADAARTAGVTTMSVWRWMKQPAFTQALREARRRVLDSAIAEICQLTTDAVAALRRNLSCGDAAVETRVALGVLEHCRELIQNDEIEARLAALEADQQSQPRFRGSARAAS